MRLGEITDSHKSFDRGLPPEAIPLSQRAGSQLCIQDGEAIAKAADPATLINGYPQECYVLDAEGLLFFRTSQFDRCALQRFWAWVIGLQYDADVDAINTIMEDMFGSEYIITHNPVNGTKPYVLIGQNPSCSFVCLNGTDNYQQLSLQAFDLFRMPRNFGILACAEIVYSTSTYVIERMDAAGVDQTKPVFLVGHSYGGAIALVTAARLKHGQPNRKIRYLTYGSPKPGNAELATSLRSMAGLNIVCDQDWVGVLPPDIPLSWPVQVALSNPFVTFSAWDKPGAQALLKEDGELLADTNPSMDSATLLAMVERALASLPQLPILAHGIPTYYERTTVRCPDVEWPIGQDVQDDMQQGGFSNTCDTSIPLVDEQLFEATIEDGQQHWFVYPQGAGTFRWMHVTGGGVGTNFGIDVFWGDCSGLFLVQQRVPPGAFLFIPPGVDTIVHLQLGTLLPVDYTLKISAAP